MFERISASFALARSSWDVLRTDKQLIIFPILSGLGCLLVMAGFALPFVAKPEWLQQIGNEFDRNGQPPIWTYAVVFAYYFVSYFVVIFCNAALISCALIRFNGDEPTIGDGFAAAFRCLPQILAWALVSATVGVLLKVVENMHEKAGAIISAILGTAWTVMTYFVIPVLVVERVGPFRAVGRSISVLRKTWGEALVGQFGLGFIMFLVSLPGIALLIIGALVATKILALGIGLIVVAVLWFVLTAVISSALDGIFVGALYQYAAQGTVPASFEEETMRRAFAHKSA